MGQPLLYIMYSIFTPGPNICPPLLYLYLQKGQMCAHPLLYLYLQQGKGQICAHPCNISIYNRVKYGPPLVIFIIQYIYNRAKYVSTKNYL